MTRTAETHRRRVGDTITVLPITIRDVNEAGIDTVRDLTGVEVRFTMIDAATGASTIAESSDGVTVVDAELGTVNYSFSAVAAPAAGVYYGTFVIVDGEQRQSYPVETRGLKIVIDGNFRTGEEIYHSAVGG